MNTNLKNANLTGANLEFAIELTQEQIDTAFQENGDAPKLGTGLKWNKREAIRRFEKYKKSREGIEEFENLVENS